MMTNAKSRMCSCFPDSGSTDTGFQSQVKEFGCFPFSGALQGSGGATLLTEIADIAPRRSNNNMLNDEISRKWPRFECRFVTMILDGGLNLGGRREF